MSRVTLLLALLLACRSPQEAPRACSDCQSGPTPPTGYPTIVLKTYKVPPGQDKLVERLLDGTTSYPVSVVSAQGNQTQFVNPRPHFTGNGYFVLSAPETIHEGVRQLLDELGKHPAAPPQASIDTTYWLVLGWPAKDPVIPDRLAEIAPALKTLSSLGSMRFDLLERLSLIALDDQEARASGQTAKIKQTASHDSGAFELRVEVETTGETLGRIDTTVTVKPGQFAVSRVGLMRLSADGRRLVTVPSYLGEAAPPALWDLERYRLRATLDGHVGRVWSARFVRDGREILTAGGDGTARSWDAESGRFRGAYRDSRRLAIVDATLTPDGAMVVAGGEDGHLRFWEATSARLLWTLPAHKSALIAMHFEGADIVTRGFGGDVSRWTLPGAHGIVELSAAEAR